MSAYRSFDRFVVDHLGEGHKADDVRDAINLVASKQRLPGSCANVRIAFDSSLEHAGSYEGGDEPVILLDPSTDSLRETLVHEVAHYMDDVLCQESESGVDGSLSDAPDFVAWLEAAALSEQVTQWLGIRKQVWAKMVFSTTGESIFDWAEYLLAPAELWARGYVQFLAEWSGDAALQQSVKTGAPPHEPAYPVYWTETDFRPIGEAIRQILINRTGYKP